MAACQPSGSLVLTMLGYPPHPAEEMSTKLKNIAKYRPFGLEKHHNEKFLAQLLNTDISYMTSDEGQMLLRRL